MSIAERGYRIQDRRQYCMVGIQDTGKGSVLQGGDIYRIQERCQYGIERIQESCEIAGLGYKIQERGQ